MRLIIIATITIVSLTFLKDNWSALNPKNNILTIKAKIILTKINLKKLKTSFPLE